MNLTNTLKTQLKILCSRPCKQNTLTNGDREVDNWNVRYICKAEM